MTRPLRAVLVAATALILTALTAVTAGTAGSAAARPAPEPGKPLPAARHAGASKLLVFVIENHSRSQMQAQLPWAFRLAKRYGYAANYHAMTHPSLPNYLAIAGGSTFGVHDDRNPSAHRLKGPSVFGAARRAGKTARVYAESMPSRCSVRNSGNYAVRHNPWTYFVHERRGCRRQDLPMGRFHRDVARGRLPDAGMVVPNVCSDAHDCSMATANAFLRRAVGTAMSGPDFESGRLAIVITADEDDGSQGNTVLTIMLHPSVRGVVTRSPLSHLSLCRLYTQVLGVAPLRGAAHAPSMRKAFGLALAH